MPGLLAPLPKPRMMKLVFALDCSCDTRSEGTSVCRSFRSRIWARSMVSAVVTETATGTSCRVCSRLVAVTMISLPSATSSTASGAGGASSSTGTLWA